MTQEEQKVQNAIDKLRQEGVEIKVHHCQPEPDATPDDGYAYTGETLISVAFSYDYDAFDAAHAITEHLTEGYDSGAGCGYRDLQLCRLLPNIH